MFDDNYEEYCPSCSESWDGFECLNCGYAESLGANEYETPEGNIVYCSEQEAMSQGLISICPSCCENIITWWELEDHGVCITCWHKRRIRSLTK